MKRKQVDRDNRDNSKDEKWIEDSWDGPVAWRNSEFETQPRDGRPDKRTVLIALTVVMTVLLSAIGYYFQYYNAVTKKLKILFIPNFFFNISILGFNCLHIAAQSA